MREQEEITHSESASQRALEVCAFPEGKVGLGHWRRPPGGGGGGGAFVSSRRSCLLGPRAGNGSKAVGNEGNLVLFEKSLPCWGCAVSDGLSFYLFKLYT